MGIFRGVYVYQSTPPLNKTRFIPMQRDLEVALHLGKFTLEIGRAHV